MKKSGGFLNSFLGKSRKSRPTGRDRTIAPSPTSPTAPTVPTSDARTAERAERPAQGQYQRLTDDRLSAARRLEQKRSERSQRRGFLGFARQQPKNSKANNPKANPAKATARPIPKGRPPASSQPPFATNPLAQKRSNPKASDARPRSAQVVNFPQKPGQTSGRNNPNDRPSFSDRPSLSDLRARRQQRPPRKHALFTPPDNPIVLPRPRNRPETVLLYALRLLILGVGLGVISGTVLSIWDPATRFSAGANSQAQERVEEQPALQLTQELTPLKEQIKGLLAKRPTLAPSILLADLDRHTYVDIAGSEVVAAASTIKLPVLVAFFQDVDQNKIQLDQPIVMRKELIATEAGDMQFQPPGSKFSAIKTVTEMMVSSDNTATNMAIDLLGGMDALNQRFKSWGLTATMLRNPLPDIPGTNTTSAKDMAQVLSQLSEGKLVSSKSRDRIFDIMRRVEYNTLLPKGVGEGGSIAHKTGTIGTMLADVGLIDTATGKRYVAAVLVKRPRNDESADELIQQISRLGYQAFNQEQAAQPNNQDPKNKPKTPEGRSQIAQP